MLNRHPHRISSEGSENSSKKTCEAATNIEAKIIVHKYLNIILINVVTVTVISAGT